MRRNVVAGSVLDTFDDIHEGIGSDVFRPAPLQLTVGLFFL